MADNLALASYDDMLLKDGIFLFELDQMYDRIVEKTGKTFEMLAKVDEIRRTPNNIYFFSQDLTPVDRENASYALVNTGIRSFPNSENPQGDYLLISCVGSSKKYNNFSGKFVLTADELVNVAGKRSAEPKEVLARRAKLINKTVEGEDVDINLYYASVLSTPKQAFELQRRPLIKPKTPPSSLEELEARIRGQKLPKQDEIEKIKNTEQMTSDSKKDSEEMTISEPAVENAVPFSMPEESQIMEERAKQNVCIITTDIDPTITLPDLKQFDKIYTIYTEDSNFPYKVTAQMRKLPQDKLIDIPWDTEHKQMHLAFLYGYLMAQASHVEVLTSEDSKALIDRFTAPTDDADIQVNFTTTQNVMKVSYKKTEEKVPEAPAPEPQKKEKNKKTTTPKVNNDIKSRIHEIIKDIDTHNQYTQAVIDIFQKVENADGINKFLRETKGFGPSGMVKYGKPLTALFKEWKEES